MKWFKRFLVGLLALLMLAMIAATAAYVTPLDTYVPEVEKVLSGQLGEPVSVRHLRIAVMPLPHLELLDVHVGGAEGIAVQLVDVELDLPSLMAGGTVVRRIVVRDGTAHLALVRRLVDRFANAPVVSQLMAIRELQLAGMSLIAPEATLAQVEGKLEFTQSGQLERAWFAVDGQKATVTLLPLSLPSASAGVPQQGPHFALQLQAHGWTPPKIEQFPQMLLDDLQIDGVLGAQDFVARQFAIATLGMRVAGSGKVDFADGWRVQAKLTRADAPLEQVMALLGKPPGFTGALSARGELSGNAAWLSALKDNLHFAGNIQIRHAAARFAAALQHPLMFEQIRAHVVAHPEAIELSSLEAKLYGGQLSGTASINNRTAVLAADVAVSGIAIQHLVEALTNEILCTGSMDGAAKFAMHLEAFKQFPKNLQLSGNYRLRNGMLTKVDLLQAASNPGKGGAKGGSTSFDELTGLLKVDANGYHFSQIKITSGSLKAEGKLNIDPAWQISGTLDANVKNTAGLVSMPMVLSGTLSNPSVRPSGSVLAGAAVGTAILGPGIGTAIGVKVGGFMGRLFGKDDDERPQDKTMKLPARQPQ